VPSGTARAANAQPWLAAAGLSVQQGTVVVESNQTGRSSITPEILEIARTSRGRHSLLHTGWHKYYEAPQQDLVKYFCSIRVRPRHPALVWKRNQVVRLGHPLGYAMTPRSANRRYIARSYQADAKTPAGFRTSNTSTVSAACHRYVSVPTTVPGRLAARRTRGDIECAEPALPDRRIPVALLRLESCPCRILCSPTRRCGRPTRATPPRIIQAETLTPMLPPPFYGKGGEGFRAANAGYVSAVLPLTKYSCARLTSPGRSGE